MLNACSASPHSARIQLTLIEGIQNMTVMATPAAVEPPTPKNVARRGDMTHRCLRRPTPSPESQDWLDALRLCVV